MRLPMSSPLHRVIQNRNSSYFDDDMPSSSPYSIELPYLGAILLGKSPLNLTSFKKPLCQLYIPCCDEHIQDKRRLIISDRDILIFEPDAAVKGKRTFIYSNSDTIVDIQILKLSVIINNTDNQQEKHMQVAFLPIGKFEYKRIFCKARVTIEVEMLWFENCFLFIFLVVSRFRIVNFIILLTVAA